MEAGRCGERAERCQWQRKRSERVAAVKIFGVRRKAAQKFWAPQQGHRPLRKRYKECDAVRNPPVTASPCQPPLGKGAMGTGDTDCHGQCSHWPRNDTSQEVRGSGGAHGPRPTRAFARIAGGQGRPPLRCCVTKKSVGEGLCPSRGRGNRRSAAGGGCSEPVSRKCPDWRTRQWPSVGWHDGGQENPAPTEALQGV